MKQIASRDNPLVKKIRALANSARDRRKHGQTVLDGDHLVRAAFEAGLALEVVLVSPQGLGRSPIRDLVALAESRCPVATVPDDVFDQMSPVANPSGVLGLIAIPASSPPPLEGDAVLLDQVQDAGNLGTLMRSATAAGIAHVVLTSGCAQAWSPKTLRAAMGAHFVCSVHENIDAQSWLAGYSGQIYATSLGDASVDLYQADLRRPGVWLFGAEGAGLSDALLARATQRLTIPMTGQVESLNVSAAAAVCLFEQLRQRRH